MALSIVDPGMVQTLQNWLYNPTYFTDPSSWTDSADAAPTFDTQHVVYMSAPQDSASQDSIGDNSNGLEDPLHLIPSLSYAWTTGYSLQHTTSQAVTVGITQALNYTFVPGFGGSTSLSVSGSYSTSDATTLTNSIQAPFDIPKGKIYEEKLLFSQEQAQVPFVTTIHLHGYTVYVDTT